MRFNVQWRYQYILAWQSRAEQSGWMSEQELGGISMAELISMPNNGHDAADVSWRVGFVRTRSRRRVGGPLSLNYEFSTINARVTQIPH